MSELSITGKVFKVSAIESGVSNAGREWKKQTIVLEQTLQNAKGEEYVRHYAFTAFGDKVDHVAKVNVGQEVTVHFNLESREYNGRWYTDAQLWKISTDEAQPAAPAPTSAQVAAMLEEDTELPF